jgi:ABC-2 type transport system permease protein
MKTLIQFVKKEIYHIFRDPRTLLVLFGMPLIQLILFGFAIRTEVNNAEVAVLDKSKDDVTIEIINKLNASNYISLVEELRNESEIKKVFEAGKAKQVIVFEQDFAKNLISEREASVQLINDASNPNEASLINTYISQIINDYQKDLIKSGISGKLLIQPKVLMLYNPQLESVYMFVPGLIAMILMLVSALMTSIAITKEKELGTMEVLLISPLKPAVIIIGKVIPYIVLAFINAISVLVLSILVFGVPFEGSLILFLGVTTLFILNALSLGILISTIAVTQQVAMMAALAGLLMPTVLLSGFIFPVENMPYFLQLISHVIPAKWFLIILKGIMLKGLGIEYLWKEILIIAGMMIVFLTISVKKFKIRLD